MEEKTYISKTIDSIENCEILYDENAKALLADKQVISRILKYTMSEFKAMEIDDIIKCIGEVEIGKIPVDPGLTNSSYGKLSQSSTEDNVPNEGIIFYDLRFSVYLNDKVTKILLNIEAQRSTKKSKLKYNLGNRIVFYLARMISAQKEVEFLGSDYDKIKKVVSIWVCLDGVSEKGSIERLVLKPERLYGNETGILDTDLIEAYVISIRENIELEVSKNKLISLLEDLFAEKDAEKKKKKLVEKHKMVMSVEFEGRARNMCNWSQAIREGAIEEGIKEGIKEGKILGTIEALLSVGMSKDEVVNRLVQNYDLDVVTAEKKFEEIAGIKSEMD